MKKLILVACMTLTATSCAMTTAEQPLTPKAKEMLDQFSCNESGKVRQYGWVYVLFDEGSAEIRQDQDQKLRDLAGFLTHTTEEHTLVLTGRANTGDYPYVGRELKQRRIMSVERRLLELDVNPCLFFWRQDGSPEYKQSVELGRRQNRRVTVRVEIACPHNRRPPKQRR